MVTLYLQRKDSPMSQCCILAIDTSCDDTSAAVTSGRVILSNVVASQTQLHKQFGGVFPTVAKQAHHEHIDAVVRAALRRANLEIKDIAAIAVTQGPGLAPALEIGIEKAKQLALELHLPLIPINHVESHALSALALPQTKIAQAHQLPQLPALAIVVSGGHTEFILIKKIGEYERLGFTVDDAAGEALDKFGRMIDLGYPAGPIIEQFARKGNPHAYTFPLPMTTSGNANLSFSGLKTAARSLTEKITTDHPLSKQEIYDLCASFQYSVFRAITYKLNKFLLNQKSTPAKNQIFAIWLGGGVASNMALRTAIRKTIRPYNLRLLTPYTKRLCIDNAAMIGVTAGFYFQQKKYLTSEADIQNVQRIPRWKVDQN